MNSVISPGTAFTLHIVMCMRYLVLITTTVYNVNDVPADTALFLGGKCDTNMFPCIANILGIICFNYIFCHHIGEIPIIHQQHYDSFPSVYNYILTHFYLTFFLLTAFVLYTTVTSTICPSLALRLASLICDNLFLLHSWCSIR